MKANILKNISISKTIAISDAANEMIKSGRRVINLSVGEPDIASPVEARNAAIEAINNDFSKYPPLTGYSDFKKAIIRKFEKENSIGFKENEIIVGAGAKQCIYNALIGTLNPGDEVLLQRPYWVSYPAMVQMAGANVVEFDSDDENRLNISSLEKSITNKSRWLIINSPCNPSGVVMSEVELDAIAVIVRKNPNLLVLSDDIYEKLVYKGNFLNILNVAPDLKDRVLIVNGISKGCAMTGWRIGYAAGPREIISAMSIVQSQSTSSVCSIAQKGAIGALSADRSYFVNALSTFKDRKDFVFSALRDIPGLKVSDPDGAFYFLVSCEKFIGKIMKSGEVINDDEDFAKFLLEEGGVATVPGSEFGKSGTFRISYATSLDNLKLAMDGIRKSCTSIFSL